MSKNLSVLFALTAGVLISGCAQRAATLGTLSSDQIEADSPQLVGISVALFPEKAPVTQVFTIETSLQMKGENLSIPPQYHTLPVGDSSAAPQTALVLFDFNGNAENKDMPVFSDPDTLKSLVHCLDLEGKKAYKVSVSPDLPAGTLSDIQKAQGFGMILPAPLP